MGNQQKEESGCGFRGKILAKLGPNIVKKQRLLSLGFFSYFAWEEYISKQEVEVIEIPEWKLKVKIARNITFEEN